MEIGKDDVGRTRKRIHILVEKKSVAVQMKEEIINELNDLEGKMGMLFDDDKEIPPVLF